MGSSRYLLVDEERRSHVEGWSRRRLGYEGDVLQAFRERAGVVHLLGVDVLRGDAARLRLEREGDAWRVLRRGAGDVGLLDRRRSAASRSALVAPLPPPSMARERMGRARQSSFPHAGKTSPVPPLAGGLSATIVAVARRWKEYHVVVAVERHELEAPETEYRPGSKRSSETAHLELDGKSLVNTQQAPTWRANCRRFETGGVLEPTSESAACPSPDGSSAWSERKGGNGEREWSVAGAGSW
jgi:hypothetical protein